MLTFLTPNLNKALPLGGVPIAIGREGCLKNKAHQLAGFVYVIAMQYNTPLALAGLVVVHHMYGTVFHYGSECRGWM